MIDMRVMFNGRMSFDLAEAEQLSEGSKLVPFSPAWPHAGVVGVHGCGAVKDLPMRY